MRILNNPLGALASLSAAKSFGGSTGVECASANGTKLGKLEETVCDARPGTRGLLCSIQTIECDLVCRNGVSSKENCKTSSSSDVSCCSTPECPCSVEGTFS